MNFTLYINTHIPQEVIGQILLDSKHNEIHLKSVTQLLKPDHIADITWLRTHANETLQMVTTLTMLEIDAYINSQIHQFDGFITSLQPVTFELIDYSEVHTTRILPDFLHSRICIIITKNHLHHSDKYSFDIDKSHFHTLKEADRMQLYYRLQHAITLLQGQTQFNHFIQISPLIKSTHTKLSSPMSSVLEYYSLKPLHLDYLRYIAMGMTSKEIAQKMHKSHRTVEDVISLLRHKTNATSKNELMTIANIISSYE